MKLTVGKGTGRTTEKTGGEGIVFLLGILFMCLILLSPVSKVEESGFQADAALVMGKVEEVYIPKDAEASVPEKWSFYDYIGKMFADLLFGEW